MADPIPAISVLIITRNRAALLDSLVRNLLKQELTRSFEIVVVDDGSTDDTRRILGDLGPSVRWQSVPHSGVAKARNAAARLARGNVLAWTDDDCVPATDWLRVIEREMDSHESRCALLGKTYSELAASAFVHSVFTDPESVITCNFAVSRGAFEAIGGFDEHFRWYFEDSDLGFRLQAAGTPVRYVPEMIVRHPSRYQNFFQYLRQRRGLQFYYYMNRKHPDAHIWDSLKDVRSRIRMRFLTLGIPILVGLVWPPAFLITLAVIAVYIAVDFRRLSRTFASLAGTGLPRRRIDLLVFALLNWTVPFYDAFQLGRGWLRDRSKVVSHR